MQDLYTKILKSKKFQKFGIPFLVFILVSLGFFASQLFSGQVEASWWDDSWIYRQPIQITNNTSEESNAYIEIDLDTSNSGSFQSDCGDIRFTTNSGSRLDYYIVSGCGTASTTIHIKYPKLLSDSQVLYFYYGNNTAANGFSDTDFSTEASNYTVGSTGSQEIGPGPVAYWDFSEGSGTTVSDKSGQAIDAQIPSNSWGGEDCLLSDCFASQSSASVVSAPNDEKLNNDNITIQGWIKSSSTDGVIAKKTIGFFSDESDGSITINDTKDINTDNIAAGRTCADGGDAVSYTVSGLSVASATTSFVPENGCLAPNDKVILINLQGTASNYDNVGNYEIFDIESIEGNIINFTENKSGYYGDGPSDDLNLGEHFYFERSSVFAVGISSLDVGGYSVPAFADLDGDGDQDMVVGEYDGVLNWYKNVGDNNRPSWLEASESFASGISDLDVGGFSFPVFADIDSDGDYDLFVPDSTGISYRPYENIGDEYSPQWQFNDDFDAGMSGPYYSKKLSFADLDGDGDLDAVSGETDGTLYWQINIGSSTVPSFQATTSLASGIENIDVGFRSKPSFADVDGDGDYDLMVGSQSNGIFWYENSSSSSPSWATSTSISKNYDGKNDWGTHLSPSFPDLNGDGIPDLVIGRADGTLSWNTRIKKPTSATQKVILQRVPNYLSVTVGSGGVLQSSAWDGSKGGVLAFFANTLIVENGGSLNVNSKGYRGGSDFANYGIDDFGDQGESYGGVGVESTSANLGGGGYYHDYNSWECENYLYFGGAGHFNSGSSRGSANGGNSYGTSTLSKMYLGSGGISEGSGIVYLNSESISVDASSTIAATDSGGAGGSIFISAKDINFSSGTIDASGGNGGLEADNCDRGIAPNVWRWGTSSDGYIHLKSETITGTTSPAAATSSASIASTSPYKIELVNGKAVVSVTVGGVQYSATSTTSVNDNDFHLLTGTYDGEELKIYIDSILQDTNSTPSGSVDSSEGGIIMGEGFLSSYIDEVKIYPYARDAGQVKLDYNNLSFQISSNNDIGVSFGNPDIQTHDPIAYWPLDDSSGAKAYDYGFDNNHGDITGATWESSANCLVGTCLSVATGSDVVSIPHSDTLLTDKITMSGWAKTTASSGDIVVKNDNHSIEATRTGNLYTSQSIAGQGASVGSFSVTIPADADIAIVAATGEITETGNPYFFDKMDWVNGSSSDFTHIISYDEGQNSTLDYLEALYMTSDDANWPGSGATTLYWSSSENLIPEGFNIAVFFYKNVDKTNPIVSSQTQSSGTGNWTSSLSGVGPKDIGIILTRGHYYDDGKGGVGGAINVTPSGYNQTNIWTTSQAQAYRDALIGIAEESGESALRAEGPGTYTRSAAFALAVKDSGIAYTENYGLELKDGKANMKIAIGDTEYDLTGTSTINDNSWHHIVGTYDETTMKLYVDGVLETSTTSASGPIDTSVDNLELASNFSSGSFDEIKIYNYVRVAGQISEDYGYGSSGEEVTRTVIARFGDDSEFSRYCGPGYEGFCEYPILELKMDQKSGATSTDTSTSSTHGILGGDGAGSDMPDWTRGKVGYALDFDGDDYVEVGDTFHSDAFSVCAWAKADSLNGTGDSNIVSKLNSSGINQAATSGEWTLGITNGKASFRSWNTSDTQTLSVTGTTTIPVSEWHYLCGVQAGNGNESYVYLDGVMDGRATQASAMKDSDYPIQLGVRSNDDNSTYWDGLIDSVSIYGYARSSAQIAWDYDKGKAITHWDLDECQGSIAHNYNHNLYHGTINIGAGGTQTELGVCQIANSSAAWYNGLEGEEMSSISLDGTDDYINVGDYDKLFLPDDFSISAWIKLDSLGTNQYIISDYDSAAQTSSFSLLVNASNKLEFSWENPNGTTPSVESQTVLTTGEWYNVFAVLENGNRKLYINNSLEDQDSTAQQRADVGGSISIGRAGENDSGYFSGQLDDIKIWTYPTNESQIQIEYNDGTVSF